MGQNYAHVWSVVNASVQGSTTDPTVNIIFDQPGQIWIYVVETTQAGCVNTDSMLVVVLPNGNNSVTGSIEGSFALTPIPTSDELVVSGMRASSAVWCSVIDVNGSVIMEENGNIDSGVLRLDVRRLAQGCYVLKIRTDRTMLSGRFVVQR